MTVPVTGSSRLSMLHAVTGELEMNTARLHAMAMGRAHGLDADSIDRLGIVVTEMGRNISRHAGTGHIVLRAIGEHAFGCIEVLALDKGPGVADMTRAMRDGGSISGAKAADGGFAGIRRLADLFDIYSHKAHGTAVVAHVGSPARPDGTCRCADSLTHVCVGVVCVALDGEEECGDAWALESVSGRLAALLVDGLGHGPGAAIAAHAAICAFQETVTKTPEMMLGAMDIALHETRGAALSVMVIDQSRRTARFCGVGNVDGRVVTTETNQHLIPQNGIVGHTMPRAQAAEVPWPIGGRLVLHSDGISSRWRADVYPGLLARHPALLAGVIFRDFARARDDATVLVLCDTLPATTPERR